MKKLVLILVSTFACVTVFAQKNTFKIDYRFYIEEEIKKIDVENEKDETKRQLAFTALMASMFQSEDKPLAEIWTNDEDLRVSSSVLQETIQIINKKTKEGFTLYPELKQYTVSMGVSDKILQVGAEEYELASDLPIKFVKGQEKTIAGYSCKLAKIQVDNATNIDIWYTDKLPQLYWGEYGYLEKIPGAALRISTMGIGIEASSVSKTASDSSLFIVPDGYTLTEGLVDNTFEYTEEELAENRFIYLDTTTNLYGIRDSSNNTVTEAIFSYITPFDNGQSIVSNSDYKYGTIDLDGHQLLPQAYDYLAYDPYTEMFSFGVNDKYGLMDAKGKIIIPNKFESLSFFVNNHAIITQGAKYGLLNLEGKVVVPPTHEYISENTERHFVSMIDSGKYVIYDIATDKKLSPEFEYISSANENNIFLAMKNDKYGYIDASGKTIIPFKYTMASVFTDGVASVTLSETEDFFWINPQGEKVNILEE